MVSAALPRKILQSNQHAKVNNRQSVFRHCTVFSHLLAPDIHNRNPAGPITCRLKQTAFSSREYRSCGTSSGRPRAGPKVNLLAVALGNMRMGISESRARFRRTAIRYSSRRWCGMGARDIQPRRLRNRWHVCPPSPRASGPACGHGPTVFRVFDARVTAMAPDLSNGFDSLCIYT